MGDYIMKRKRNQLSIFLLAVLLIMTVYYINNGDVSLIDVGKTVTTTTSNKSGNSIFDTLRNQIDNDRKAKIASLQAIINDSKKSTEEKTSALAEINQIKANQDNEDILETNIKNLGYSDVFVTIDKNNVSINIYSSDHTVQKANDIILLTKNKLGNSKNITVYFQSK